MKMNTFKYNNTTILRIQNYCIRIYIQFLNTIMEYNITTYNHACMSVICPVHTLHMYARQSYVLKFQHGCKLRKQVLQGLYSVLDVSA